MFRLYRKGFFMKKNTAEAEISNYTGKLLRDNFGKGPGSIYVSIQEPLITIYLKDFLAPMEKVLLKQSNNLKVEETRDVLMNELIPDIKAALRNIIEIDVESIFYDWSLDNRSGMIFTTFNQENPISLNDYAGKDAIHEEIERISIQAERQPEEIESSMMNPRTLAIVRRGVLVDIEKELIANGFIEELKLSKRKLEKRLLNNPRLKTLMNGRIEDIFVDWDFELDRGYTIIISKPDKAV